MRSHSVVSADRSLRDLPPGGWPRVWTLLRRALGRRCPQCGARGIFRRWFSLAECCPRCGYIFVREEGYFLGAYAINLIVAEFIGLGAVVYLLIKTDFSLWVQEAIAVTTAVALPVIFFPYSRTLWMALDLLIHRDVSERQLRAEHTLRTPRE
ncbi:MAG: hypothetical protein KatS3mg059_0949 [Thermomicrobiales bacterium]|nr:MAG: hypothetical protein KatS3mg059_0949 [Thermomicrobiales bacterium]